MTTENKDIAELTTKINKLNKQYKSVNQVVFVRSGSVVLDSILGGGIPMGVFISCTAEEGCGKSTLALHMSKVFCMQGKKVCYLDYEGVNDKQIEGMGLREYHRTEENPDGPFILYQVQTFRDAETILDEIMLYVDLVVIDSATAILTEKVKGSSSEDALPGVDSRVMSVFLKKYKAESIRNGITWFIINQMRTKISFLGPSSEVEAGGKAMKFYPDIRLQMKRAYKGSLERVEETAIGQQKVPFGAICMIWAEKNRYERPKIPLNIAIIFGKGVSNEYAYYDYLTFKKTIVKTGAWYQIKLNDINVKLNGINKVIDWINENKDTVRNYINSTGGYKLMLKESKPVNIGLSAEMKEDVYGEEVLTGDFDTMVDGRDLPDSIEEVGEGVQSE